MSSKQAHATPVRDAELATFRQRLAAGILDLLFANILLAAVIGALLGTFLGQFGGELVQIGSNSIDLANQPEMVHSLRKFAIAASVCSVVINLLYFSLLTCSKRQATFGKRILGLRVISEDGSDVGPGQALRRYFFLLSYQWLAAVSSLLTLRLDAQTLVKDSQPTSEQLISIFSGPLPSALATGVLNAATFLTVISIMWILWDKRRQGLHDKFAETLVVKRT